MAVVVKSGRANVGAVAACAERDDAPFGAHGGGSCENGGKREKERFHNMMRNK